MSEKVLALDLSTTETGYALFQDESIVRFDIIKPSSKLSALERSIEVAWAIEELIDLHEPDEVVIESTYMAFPQSAELLGRLHGMIIWIWKNYSSKLPIYLVATHIRKVMGIKGVIRGKEGKKAIINYVERLTNLTIGNDNVADAILTGLCYLKEKQNG